MNNQHIAVLLTCHNRKEKTLACLTSLYAAELPDGYDFEVYLVDDGCTDGTGEAISIKFPSINIVEGDGNLYWAGGMRLAWKTAMKVQNYDAYLLINDDVILGADFLHNFIDTEKFSIVTTGMKGIYTGATREKNSDKITYGGARIKSNHIIATFENLNPTQYPQPCDMANANILWVGKEVINKIGIFDERFTHGIADYDYSLSARKNDIPVFLAPNICGVCTDDHGNNWMSSEVPLKKRIGYLKSPTGLAYKEYLYYIRKHFPLYFPCSFALLWLKVLFPGAWERYKKKQQINLQKL